MRGEWTGEEHEAGIALFIDPEHRQRFRAVLGMGNRKRQKTLPAYLCHFGYALDRRFAGHVPAADQSDARVKAILQSRGAPPVCYVVSGNADLDGTSMTLDEALGRVGDELRKGGLGEGVMISCIPGQLGSYHDHEDWDSQYVLHRPDG